jgi:hypothetical protein
VGLQDFKEKAIYELSGGMQQRVALARCLANDPDVILMDEPLGALDALTREKMQGLVLKLWKETGKTIILITHSVEEALLLGERLLVMAPRPGRIHKEYRLPFADMGVGADLREVKKHPRFGETREEILEHDLGHGRGNHGPHGGGAMIVFILSSMSRSSLVFPTRYRFFVPQDITHDFTFAQDGDLRRRKRGYAEPDRIGRLGHRLIFLIWGASPAR